MLPAFMTYSEQGIDAIEAYTNYKRVDGVQVAHSRQTLSPQGNIVVEVESVKINEAMNLSLFAKPE